MIVCGGNNAGDFLKLLGNGQEFGLKRLFYAYQEREGGIAEAIGLAQNFAENDLMTVILGDNIFGCNIKPYVEAFESQGKGARIILKEVPNPREYGVPRFEDKRIIEIIEKPKKPPSNFAVVGLYMYDSKVFEIIKGLKPSRRGELEVTDINNWYLRANELQYSFLDCWWIDAGESIKAYYKAIALVAEKEEGVKIFN
jgi:glucose-1-phosphate thymidylyltransferase